MTVSTEVDHNEYTGNGVTTSFPYTFRVFNKSDLVVQVVDLDENITVLALDTDYTVTGAGGYNGGNVILSKALANGYQISISRELPVTQETDLRNQGKFFAEVHEDAFDKLTMLIQQVRSWFTLALRKPSFMANYYDALNNYIRNLRDPLRPQDAATRNYVDNTVTHNINHTIRVPDAYIEPLPPIGQMEGCIIGILNGKPVSYPVPSGTAADVFNQLASGDNGKGDALITVNQPIIGGIIRTQHHKNADFVSAKDFGFKGDGTNDDAAVINITNYVNSRPKYSPPVEIYFPYGEYLINNSLWFIRPVTIYSNKGATINYSGSEFAIILGDDSDENNPTADNFYQGDYSVTGIRLTGGEMALGGIKIKSAVYTPKIRYCDFIDYGNKDSYDIYAQFENWDILIEGCYKKTFYSRVAIGNFISIVGKKTDGSAYDGGNSRVTVRDCAMSAYDNQDLGYFAYINCVKGRVIGGSAHHSTGGILLGPAASGTLIDGFYCEVSTQHRPWVISVLSDKTNPANYLFPQSVTVRNVYVNMHKEKIGNAGKLIGVMDADVKLRDWSVTDCQISNFENGQVLIDRNDLNEQTGNTYARINPIFVPYNAGGGSKFIVTGKLTTAEDWSCGDIETGVWIPTVGGNATYYQQKGNYVRNGNIITATCHLGITLIGTGDGFRIGGLPYVSSNKTAYVGSTGYYNNLTTEVTALLPRVDANSSYITLTGATTLSGNMDIYKNVLGNNAEVIITVTYEID